MCRVRGSVGGENAQICICSDAASCSMITPHLEDGMHKDDRGGEIPRAAWFGNIYRFISRHYEIPASLLQMMAEQAAVF